jgi:hypothetical protein
MATPRKKWPQSSEWARLDAIALAMDAWRVLDELLDELSEVRHVRRVGRVMENMKEIRFKLTICKEEKGDDS